MSTEVLDSPTDDEMLAIAQRLDAIRESGEDPDDEDALKDDAASREDGMEESQEPKTDEEQPEPDKSTQPDPEEAPREEAKLTREQKAEARAAEEWKRVQAEKEHLKQLEQQVQTREAELARREAALAKPPEAIVAKSSTGHTAQDYRDLAEKLYAEGDFDLAKQALATSQELDRETQALQAKHQAELAEYDKTKFSEDWTAAMSRMVKENPDLADQSNPRAQMVLSLLQHNPEFERIPDGFAKVVRIADGQLALQKLPELQAQLDKATAELKRLNRSTSPASKAASRGFAKTKTFDEMTHEERGAYLERQAAELDINRGF